MNCTNFCNQGRSACPTPHACGLAPRKLHQANSDGSSSGSATAPMPISMEAGPEDAYDDSGFSPTELILIFITAVSTIFTVAMLAGYVMVKLS